MATKQPPKVGDVMVIDGRREQVESVKVFYRGACIVVYELKLRKGGPDGD